MVKEEMHLQENILFDFWPWLGVKVTRNVAQFPQGSIREYGQADRRTDDGPTLVMLGRFTRLNKQVLSNKDEVPCSLTQHMWFLRYCKLLF